MHYTIHTRHEVSAVERVEFHEAVARIDALAGRQIGAYIMGRRGPMQRTGRAYVAARPHSLCTDLYGARGFVIEKVTDSA